MLKNIQYSVVNLLLLLFRLQRESLLIKFAKSFVLYQG